MYEQLKAQATDLSQTASAPDVIYTALRDQIISGNLKAGTSIRQEHVAQLFKVSRIPVREALKRLEAQGLVTLQRYKGAVVSTLSIDEMEEIYEIRANLEPLIIRRAVKNLRPETLQEARRYCDAFSAETDPSRWGEWNRQFHETLYRDANRPYHLKLIDEAIDRIDAYLRAQLILTDGMPQARREHLAILEACADGDADLAAELTHAHITDSYQVLTEVFKAQQGASS